MKQPKLQRIQEEVTRFEESHGKGIVDRFEKVLLATGSFAEVGRELQLSRSYISQLYKKLFKTSLDEVRALRRKNILNNWR